MSEHTYSEANANQRAKKRIHHIWKLAGSCIFREKTDTTAVCSTSWILKFWCNLNFRNSEFGKKSWKTIFPFHPCNTLVGVALGVVYRVHRDLGTCGHAAEAPRRAPSRYPATDTRRKPRDGLPSCAPLQEKTCWPAALKLPEFSKSEFWHNACKNVLSRATHGEGCPGVVNRVHVDLGTCGHAAEAPRRAPFLYPTGTRRKPWDGLPSCAPLQEKLKLPEFLTFWILTNLLKRSRPGTHTMREGQPGACRPRDPRALGGSPETGSLPVPRCRTAATPWTGTQQRLHCHCSNESTAESLALEEPSGRRFESLRPRDEWSAGY